MNAGNLFFDLSVEKNANDKLWNLNVSIICNLKFIIKLIYNYILQFIMQSFFLS